MTGALAAPLGLVLDSARWLVNDITDRYRVLFADLVDRESARTGGGPVPLQRLLTIAAPYLSAGMTGRGVGELAPASVAELQRRWQHVLGPPSSASRHQVSADAIAARAAECFPRAPGRLDRRPAALTRHHDRRSLTRRSRPRQLPAHPRRTAHGYEHSGGPVLGRAAPRPGPAHRRRAGRPRPAANRHYPAQGPSECDVPDQPTLSHTGARPALLVLRDHRLIRPSGIGHGPARRRDDRRPPRRRIWSSRSCRPAPNWTSSKSSGTR